ncbi:MAG: integrin alpha [Myxococcota bacterium]
MGVFRWTWFPLLFVACDPTVFGDLEDQAPTRVVEAPDDYPVIGYGRGLAAYKGTISGTTVSRLAVNAGENTPFVVYPGWTGTNVDLSVPLLEGCDRSGECDTGFGFSLIGIPRWRSGLADEGDLCIIQTAPASASLEVRCETTSLNEKFSTMGGERVGASGAALPLGHIAGVAILGAPDGNARRGLLYRLPDAARPMELVIPPDTVAEGGRLGESLAVFAIDSNTAIVAAGAPGVGRVVVASIASDGMGGIEATVRACVDNPAGDFGAAVALEDVTGDDQPELFVGSAVSAEGRLEGVEMYPGTGLPNPGACAAWGEAPVTLGCPDGASGLSCDGAGFGGALATGNVNGDGFFDLIVGAPLVDVDGESNAGAVFVLPGSAAGIDTAAAVGLTLSSPNSGDELGRSVAALPTVLNGPPRHEPVAGVPGRDSAAVFLCSGLPEDTPGAPNLRERCLP